MPIGPNWGLHLPNMSQKTSMPNSAPIYFMLLAVWILPLLKLFQETLKVGFFYEFGRLRLWILSQAETIITRIACSYLKFADDSISLMKSPIMKSHIFGLNKQIVVSSNPGLNIYFLITMTFHEANWFISRVERCTLKIGCKLLLNVVQVFIPGNWALYKKL